MKLTMEDLNEVIKEVLDEISLEKKFESLTCQHEDCAKKANHFIMTISICKWCSCKVS